MLGATYYEAEAVYGPTGPTIAHVGSSAARRGDHARRAAGAPVCSRSSAVKETDEPRSYEEMHETELAALAKARGIEVRSSSLDAAQPLRPDYIAALEAHDAGVASIAPVQVAPPEGPGRSARSVRECRTCRAPPAASTSADPALTGTGDVPTTSTR
jgi:hypothetical protein